MCRLRRHREEKVEACTRGIHRPLVDRPARQTAHELLLWVKGRGKGTDAGELVKHRDCLSETGGLYQLVTCLAEVTDKPTERGLNYKGI